MPLRVVEFPANGSRGVTIGGFSHIVVYILQSTAQNQAPKAKTHFYLVHLLRSERLQPPNSTDAEHERLIRQAQWVNPHTERCFREAGIGPGYRVLDLGSGVGDVALLLAQLVGPTGEVIGVERDPRSIGRGTE